MKISSEYFRYVNRILVWLYSRNYGFIREMDFKLQNDPKVEWPITCEGETTYVYVKERKSCQIFVLMM